MQSFWQWLSQLYPLDPTWSSSSILRNDRLFDGELEKVIAESDPACRRVLERMRGSRLDGGYRLDGQARQLPRFRGGRGEDARNRGKLLHGTLFTGYDERQHGPDGPAIQVRRGERHPNIVQKEQTRKRLLPSVSIGQEFVPGDVPAEDLPAPVAPTTTMKVIHDFRKWRGNGWVISLFAVLDARLDREETQSADRQSVPLGSPGKHRIVTVVAGIKALAREFAASLDDSELLRRVERAMAGDGRRRRRRGGRRRRRWRRGRRWREGFPALGSLRQARSPWRIPATRTADRSRQSTAFFFQEGMGRSIPVVMKAWRGGLGRAFCRK